MEDSKELAEFLQNSAEAETIDIGPDEAIINVLSVPRGREIKSIKPFLDEYRLAPERRKGTATLTDLESLIAHVNRFKDDHSALFASRDPARPQIIGVLNYHEAADGAPRYGDHRAVYAFPLSKEWKAWQTKNGIKMNQGEFAEFIENRIMDIAQPPADGEPLADMTAQIGGTFAGPSKLNEISRGMAINAEEKVKSAVNIATGEVQILYEEVHSSDKGKPLKVPSLFVISIPVFESGPLYRVAVRLRYRLANSTISWFYEMFRADKSFDHAFDEACVRARDETDLPLFYGSPEA